MKIKADTILASFVVALFSSLLTALAVLLVEILSTSLVRAQFIADLVVNIYILFFLSGFVFFKGSSIAAWLLYRHDVEWGYKIKYRQVMPIFIISFSMAVVVYFAITLDLRKISHALKYSICHARRRSTAP